MSSACKRIPYFGFPFVLFTFCVLLAAPARGSGDSSAGGDNVVKVTCDAGGNSKMLLDGKEVKVDCGANTPTKTGKLPPEENCVGSSFACMRGKECITIQGGIKFHKTNCGSGGSQPTGAIKTAGCVEMGDQDFEKLKQKAAGGNTTFMVKGPGGGSGR